MAAIQRLLGSGPAHRSGASMAVANALDQRGSKSVTAAPWSSTPGLSANGSNRRKRDIQSWANKSQVNGGLQRLPLGVVRASRSIQLRQDDPAGRLRGYLRARKRHSTRLTRCYCELFVDEHEK